MANLFGKAGQPGSYEHCNEAVINYWGAVNLGGEQLLKHGKYMQFLKFSFHKKTDDELDIYMYRAAQHDQFQMH